MKKKTKDSCENCRFWKDRMRAVGECRRRPPIIVDAGAKKALQEESWSEVVDSLWDYSRWPKTFDLDWCGEHERKQ